MPTDPQPILLSRIVQRAVAVTDPEATAGLEDLLELFEDADEPVSAWGADRLAADIRERTAHLDPQEEDPALQVALAVATYLIYRRDELDDDPDHLLQLAARAEFADAAPAGVPDWLVSRGITG